MNHAARIAVGTAVLTRRALGGTWKTMAVRGGAAAYLSPYLVNAVQPYPYVAPAGLVGWLGAAWWAGRPQQAPAEPASGHPEPPTAGPTEPLPAEAFADQLRAAANGATGVHLSAVAEHLNVTTGEPWTAADVRAHCRALHIPLSGSVRMPGRGVSTGVRLADLPDPSPAPAVAVVVAGQDTTTAAATGPTTPPQLQVRVDAGGAVRTVTDPAETRHYTVTKEARHG